VTREQMAVTARKCFVSMPTGPAFTDVYDFAILPAITENGLTPSRLEDLKSGSLWRVGMQELIKSADVVVAVINDEKSHGFTGFELGFATGLNKPIILLAQSFRELPFDLQHFRFLSYRDEPQSLAQLRRDLTKEIHRVVSLRAELSSGPPQTADQPKEMVETGGARVDGELAEDYAARGDYSAALDLLVSVIHRLRVGGDAPALAAALNSASVAYQAQGRYDEALSALQEALGLLTNVGDPRERAKIAVNLANVLVNTGDLNQARSFYQMALSIADETADLQLSAEIKSNHAHLLYLMGDLDEALYNYQHALDIFAKLGDERGVAKTEANL
jgi:tetratricopeptide (TPR) repeat protein